MENKERYAKPRTIDELRAFCEDRGMPLEKMRFFIGEDYRGAQAFGIYQDENGDFVVYKNKSDGSRAVRYQGPDEAYAVNEIYEKLKAETELRKRKTHMYRSESAPQTSSYSQKSTQSKKSGIRRFRGLIIFAVIAVLIVVFAHLDKSPSRGYYHYNDRDYYYYEDDWYGYDYGLGSWVLLDTVDSALYDNSDDYYVSKYYDDYYSSEYFDETEGPSDFTDSEYYDEYSSDSSSSSYYDDDDDYDWSWDDDDYDSGWDSWDSGDSDWDSDW